MMSSSLLSKMKMEVSSSMVVGLERKRRIRLENDVKCGTSDVKFDWRNDVKYGGADGKYAGIDCTSLREVYGL